jgi:hypothetical protein
MGGNLERHVGTPVIWVPILNRDALYNSGFILPLPPTAMRFFVYEYVCYTGMGK